MVKHRSIFSKHGCLSICPKLIKLFKVFKPSRWENTKLDLIPLTTLILTPFLALSALHSYIPASSKLMFDFMYRTLVVCCPSTSVNASDVMVTWSLTCARLSLWYSWTLSWYFEENVQLILRSLPYRAHSSDSGLIFKRDAEKYHEHSYSVWSRLIEFTILTYFWATFNECNGFILIFY